MLFDGDCGFCRRWVERWRRTVGEAVEFAPYQEAAPLPGGPSREEAAEAIHLVEPDGSVHRGASAVLRALAAGRRWRWLLAAYRWIPGFAAMAEAIYRGIAARRPALSWITSHLWGPGPTTGYLARRWFIRGIGVTYLIAFVSLAVQIDGLVGSDGILPAARYLEWVQERAGIERYWALPTWAWISSSDSALHLLCWGGAAGSVLVIVGFLPGPLLLLLWTMYLSLAVVGQTFLNFQWDALLLEAGLLAAFFAPLRGWPRLEQERPPSTLFLWLLRCLLFRLMFLSGFVKLASKDAVWWNLTALEYHYWTQPIPSWTAWYAHQLPALFQKASTAAMFAVELVVPFLIFLPRRLRIFAVLPLAALQLAIAATGNYGFFNLLTLVLCIPLLDDAVLGRLYPGRTLARLPRLASPPRWRNRALAPLAILLFVAGGTLFAARLGAGKQIPRLALQLVETIRPLRSVNNYGLFANMTETRPEIILEGSRDGQAWETYTFRWKPGDPKRRPPQLGPYMPRLDWQMWFASLQGFERAGWFRSLMGGIFRGSPAILGLLEGNPFPDQPPRYLRANLYEYRFTTPEEKRQTGAWWDRTWKGLYAPVMYNRQAATPSRP